jgi:DNA mismatch repair ATPase MutS
VLQHNVRGKCEP